MNNRSVCYYPSHDGYGSPTHVANEDLETHPALVQVVRYLRAHEALIKHITSDFVVSCTPTTRWTPASHEAATASSNHPVLARRPILSVRSAPSFMLANPTMTLVELHRSLDAFCNEVVPRASILRRRRHRNPGASFHAS